MAAAAAREVSDGSIVTCSFPCQQSKTDQQMPFRSRWSSSTSSRIASGS
jgi:hypothetical protein